MTFGLEQHIIDKIITVFEVNAKVDKAYVFGSRAKGNYRPDSDIDIAIKGNDITLDDILKMSMEFEDKGIKNKIDLLDYTNIKEPALQEHIDRVGIEFYSRWKEYRLGDVITFQRGHDLTRTDMGIGKYPVAGSNGIIGYHNTFTTKGPGVTIGRSGSIGTPHYYENNFWAHNTVLYIKDFKVSEPKFIYYFLKTIDFSQFNAGSSVPTLNRNHIHELNFLLPPKTEQTAIASILCSLDDKIDLLQRQNKTLEQMAETLFRQWFVEEAEENWETVTIGQFVKTNHQSISKDYLFHEIEYLDTSSLTEGLISETQKIALKDAPSRAKRLVQNNDLLISTVRPDQKHYGIINNPIKNLVVSTGFCVITCTDIDPHFIYLLLTSDEMTKYLHSIAEGSTSTYPSLKPSDIEKLEFLKPPKERLTEFGKLASTYWTKIHSNQKQIRTLTQTRDTLLPKLMSGEIRITL